MRTLQIGIIGIIGTFTAVGLANADEPASKPAPSQVLAKNRVLFNGDCTFLGAAGCVLPEEVRPLVCRLYPFEYTHRGILGEPRQRLDKGVILDQVAPPGGIHERVVGKPAREAVGRRRRPERLGRGNEAVGERCQRYSTVTDFARLRGWSTSVPFSTAT